MVLIPFASRRGPVEAPFPNLRPHGEPRLQAAEDHECRLPQLDGRPHYITWRCRTCWQGWRAQRGATSDEPWVWARITAPPLDFPPAA